MKPKSKLFKHPLFQTAPPPAEELIKYIRKIRRKHLRQELLVLTLAYIIVNCTETPLEGYGVIEVVKDVISCLARKLSERKP